MLSNVIKDIRQFNDDRNWGKDHTPKNLATSVLIEAAELVECFQWLTPEESYKVGNSVEVNDEVADVLIYLLNLCDKLNIYPEVAIRHKLLKNASKYPA